MELVKVSLFDPSRSRNGYDKAKYGIFQHLLRIGGSRESSIQHSISQQRVDGRERGRFRETRVKKQHERGDQNRHNERSNVRRTLVSEEIMISKKLQHARLPHPIHGSSAKINIA
ncbi:uncharacterized protein EI90DRAFT_3088221, partial [Cantharellus anzutake]|uniref:uncharacterized protein n=1 Tax=Cantharellus anzutake TaxID=1750568 RepID=UPI00190322AB